jgi:3-phenylpropionate/cinnamic acid dioxygenase small subunit
MSRSDSGFDPARRQALAGRFFEEYTRALDDRRFGEWLDLFADDAYYGIIRHEDLRRDNDLYVLGETMVKLRARVKMGGELDPQMQVHLLSGVRVDEAAGAALRVSANFALIRDTYISYAGQYRVELHCPADGTPKIRRCIVVISNDRPSDLFYLPI